MQDPEGVAGVFCQGICHFIARKAHVSLEPTYPKMEGNTVK